MTQTPSYFIEKLIKIKLDKDAIEKIGRHDFAFFSTVCFALNEIFVFHKFLVSTIHEEQKDDDVKLMIFSHQLIMMRNLSAKVVEFIDTLEAQEKVWERGRGIAFNHSGSIRSEISIAKSSVFFSLTKHLRNKMIFHYLVSEALDNIDEISERAELSLLLHNEQGNSCFPIGEEVMLLPAVAKFLKDKNKIETKEQIIKFHEGWIDWSIQSSGLCISYAMKYLSFVINKNDLGLWNEEKTYFIEPNLRADIREFKFPVILRAFKK